MLELQDFYNRGFGWICRHCRPENNNIAVGERSRLMSEGEAENKTPELSTEGLAKWADPAHRILTCPRCGISELAVKA
ncbi:MAG: hypothetical protein ACR2IH_11355 [Pyrinomonadaceae bacterium]